MHNSSTQKKKTFTSKTTISKDLVAASASPLVLSILSQGESYGYAIIKQVRELSGGQLQWTDGMLYPVLHRLERQGAITAEWRVAETGRRRKYYSLNAEGASALEQERRQWTTVHNALTQLWSKEPCPT